jgi:hypothetical protein
VKYEAIVYGYINVENGMRYVGYHKTNEENDGYVFSSDNYPLRHAWSHGLLRKTVIHRGAVDDCMTLEHYILSKNNAVTNDAWYNQSNGGGAKMYSFSQLPQSLIETADSWMENTEPQPKDKDLFLADRDLNKNIRFLIDLKTNDLRNFYES